MTHYRVYMISLKRLVYYIGDVTHDEETYMSVKDMCNFFPDEGCDYQTIYNRIASQINGHRNMFAVKKDNGRNFWRLSANGYRYLNKFKDVYDPVTDKLLFQPEKIEVF